MVNVQFVAFYYYSCIIFSPSSLLSVRTTVNYETVVPYLAAMEYCSGGHGIM